MTTDDYRRRVESGFRACEWGDDNPYRPLVAARLSDAGGLHRSPGVESDRLIMADEDAVALMRDLPAALTEPGAVF